MSLKLCFGNEIHRVPKLPVSINALKESISSVFSGRLPEKYAIHYTDCDGDNIMLTTQEDYEALLADQSNSNAKAVKIFITTPSNNNNNSATDVSQTEIIIATSEKSNLITAAAESNDLNNNYSIIQKSSSDKAADEVNALGDKASMMNS
jgi:hypothetical protein